MNENTEKTPGPQKSLIGTSVGFSAQPTLPGLIEVDSQTWSLTMRR